MVIDASQSIEDDTLNRMNIDEAKRAHTCLEVSQQFIDQNLLELLSILTLTLCL